MLGARRRTGASRGARAGGRQMRGTCRYASTPARARRPPQRTRAARAASPAAVPAMCVGGGVDQPCDWCGARPPGRRAAVPEALPWGAPRVGSAAQADQADIAKGLRMPKSVAHASGIKITVIVHVDERQKNKRKKSGWRKLLARRELPSRVLPMERHTTGDKPVGQRSSAQSAPNPSTCTNMSHVVSISIRSVQAP